jgi:hypothetical protein
MSQTNQQSQPMVEENKRTNSTPENPLRLTIQTILLNHLEFEEMDLEYMILEPLVNELIALFNSTPSIS